MKMNPVPLVLVMPLYWFCLCNHIFEVSGLCLDDQKSLLLNLKKNFTSENSTKLNSWDPSEECCSWMGVTCDKEGHVIGLDLSWESISGEFDNSSSLFSLQHLMNLNLGGNRFTFLIPSGFNRLKNLTYLDLSFNHIMWQIPTEISQLTRLVSLDLINSNLIGRFPPKIFQIATLSFIDVLQNTELHGSFPDFPLRGSLQNIRVSYTNFSGTLPHSIGNLRHLSELDLAGCQFNGTLPNSLSNLTELTYLDLSGNKFTGQLPSFEMAKKLYSIDVSNNGLSGAIPSSHFEALHNLFYINLDDNSFTGRIPSSLFRLPLLWLIQLSNNQFSELDEFINVSSSALEILYLRNNNVSGPFPEFIFQLTALSNFDISLNKFHGPMQLHKFCELKNLTSLDVSYNSLSVNVDMKNVDPSSYPNLTYINMASCNLKTFPDILRNQSGLQVLDLSNNQIHGIVPNWVWKLTYLRNLNISSNLLTELEGPMQNVSSLPNLAVLDLHNNQLQGPIPILSKHAYYLDYSRNRFSSIIPDSLCSAIGLTLLDLSINNLSGTIPSCLISNPIDLMVLNLRDNNLKGTIPDMFRASCAARTLNLHGNHLHRPIPKSLVNCSQLTVLDLGKNQITGGFPCFLKNISTLRVMVLRNNKFQGSLECGLANNEPWQFLQILDIAFNNFSGKLKRKYFTNWETMMHGEDQPVSNYIQVSFEAGYYRDSVTVSNKGLRLELVKIMTVFTSIDFSSNHFEGPIPEELMDFKALHVLNLSNNALSGEIPPSIGNLKQLESLDISQNSLHGEIPGQLASLTFLSYLNLSFNHLVGKIPTGTQRQSFQASSFEGNDGLHGPPLPEKPEGKKQGLLPQPSCKRLACTVDWNLLSAELGFTFGLGIVIGLVLFWKKWSIWYWKLVDQVLCWIFPQLYLDYETRGGQRYTVLRWWG